jgi:SAM-dependent methyltransferase
MIERRCMLCDGRVCSRVFAGLLRCSRCGIIFDDAGTSGIQPEELYGPGYYQGRVYRDYTGEKEARTAVFRRKMSIIGRLMPGRGRVLDAGCAAGYFLNVLAENGYEPYGIDVSNYAAGTVRESCAGSVVHGDIAGTAFPDGFFSAVTMWDLLEHLPDPRAALREIHRILEPGGLLVVETLNFGSLRSRIMKERWPLYAPPYHLFYFMPGTLRRFLSSSGFLPGRVMPVSTGVPWSKGGDRIALYKNPVLRLLPPSVFADVVLCTAVRET